MHHSFDCVLKFFITSYDVFNFSVFLPWPSSYSVERCSVSMNLFIFCLGLDFCWLLGLWSSKGFVSKLGSGTQWWGAAWWLGTVSRGHSESGGDPQVGCLSWVLVASVVSGPTESLCMSPPICFSGCLTCNWAVAVWGGDGSTVAGVGCEGVIVSFIFGIWTEAMRSF